MIVALCELGIPLDDARFVKNGNMLLDNLMSFYQKGAGFLHVLEGGGSNQMASEQGLYALVAAQRARTGKNSLYRMSDAITIGEDRGNQSVGLAEKHADVKPSRITAPGTTFGDISGAQAHENQMAIEALASRGIINGKSEDSFDPEGNMKRSEFATIVAKALGLTPKETTQFTDVPVGSWYAGYVGTAYQYGIVTGKDVATFDPDGTITRQEAATMVTRSAKLCGMDVTYDTQSARDVLAQFTDYVKCADWAQSSLAFCYDQKIWDNSAMTIQPTQAILRCEIAQTLYNLLSGAKLL